RASQSPPATQTTRSPTSTGATRARPGRCTAAFTGSPRLRLRLAPPRSQTRLASGCGSHRHVHRLASPPAAARTATFTDSPRLRLRLAPPRSQTRLASGCGSHRHVHRLASPPAAARTATFTDSPRLRLRLAPPPSATLAHAVELQEVRRSRHPHGRAGDD